MAAESRPARLLLAAVPREGVVLRDLFAAGLLGNWEVTEADSLVQARFLLQHSPWDVLLVDEGVYLREDGEGLVGLVQHHPVGVLLLGDMPAQALLRAWQQGIHQWLPRRATLEQPALLAAALGQAMRVGQWRRQQQLAEAALWECQRQRDRLLELLWRAVPLEDGAGWLTQRHVLERLQEEVVRSRRYGEPLSVALAEVQAPQAVDLEEGPGALAAWTAEQVAQGKRRCDLAGPYGPQGFLLLMVQTPAPGGFSCCRRLQHLLEEGQARPQGLRGPIRAYFGVASLSDAVASSARLLSRAEEHLERAREEGESRVVCEGP
jgi:diguanylate cyclase (GGDEF)-like protein